MKLSTIAILALALGACARAQTKLPTDVWVLPKPDGSAAGLIKFCDANVNPTCNTFASVGIGGGGALAFIGRATGNGNILFEPGNVSGFSSLFVLPARTDQPDLILRDGGVSSSNGLGLQTNAGVEYLSIDGSISQSPTFRALNGTLFYFVGSANFEPDASNLIQIGSNGIILTKSGVNRVQINEGAPSGGGTVAVYNNSGTATSILFGQAGIGNGGELTLTNSPLTVALGQPVTGVGLQVSGATRSLQIASGSAYSETVSTTNLWWALGDDGGGGLLRLANGTGTGGLDGLGSTILCQASANECQISGTVQAGSFSMPNGTGGLIASKGLGGNTYITISDSTNASTLTLEDNTGGGSTITMSNSGGSIVNTLNATIGIRSNVGFNANGSTGVNCTGTPTSSFATVFGIVTHC